MLKFTFIVFLNVVVAIFDRVMFYFFSQGHFGTYPKNYAIGPRYPDGYGSEGKLWSGGWKSIHISIDRKQKSLQRDSRASRSEGEAGP